MPQIPEKITGELVVGLHFVLIYAVWGFIFTGEGQSQMWSLFTTWSVFTDVSPIHNDQVCSTWGNFHYKTYDGSIFQLNSTCNYILTSSCRNTYNDFNVQIRRQDVDGYPTIKNIILKLEGVFVELSKGSVTVDGKVWVCVKKPLNPVHPACITDCFRMNGIIQSYSIRSLNIQRASSVIRTVPM